MSSASELAAQLQERVDRYNAALDVNPDADPTEILSAETAALRRGLLTAALTDESGRIRDLDGVDGFPFWVAGWSAVFRDHAFAAVGDEARSRVEDANRLRLFLVVDLVQPDQVPPHQRTLFDLVTQAGTVLDLPYRERELAEVFLTDDQADIAGLNAVAGLLRRSIEREASERADQWLTLMRVLWRRYKLSSHIDDLSEAVEAAERALALGDGTNRVVALRHIGVMEQERYDRMGTPSSRQRCLAALTEALDLTPPGDPERAATLVNLGIAMRTRGSRERSPEDVTRAIALTREALSDNAMSPPYRARALSMLALALHARFELIRREPDLVEALAVAREAASIGVAEDQAILLGNLGLVLRTRHHHHRDPDDLAELVDVARRAVALPGEGHQHGSALGLLSVALTYQAEESGRLEDLNGAIEAARGAAAALADHPDRALHLDNLAKGLLLRSEQIHSIQDLDEAIDVARLASAVSMPEDRQSSGRMSLLAAALERRYRSRQDINDLMAAAAMAEAAVLHASESSAELPILLTSLSNVRRTLAERTQQLSDIDAAIEAADQAVSVDGHVPARRPVRLFNLGSCYAVRFRISNLVTDSDRAVQLLREALATLPDHDPDRCRYMSDLAQRLVERHAADPAHPASALLEEALQLLRAAADLPDAPATDRLRAAGRWGLAAGVHGRAEDSAAGYAAAVHLLPLAAWHGLDRRSQERQLTTWNPLVTSAAALAVELGRPGQAVELLEEGRGVLWAHQLGRHTDLSALRAVRPDLAARLEEIRHALDV